jgi:hypothetical protein
MAARQQQPTIVSASTAPPPSKVAPLLPVADAVVGLWQARVPAARRYCPAQQMPEAAQFMLLTEPLPTSRLRSLGAAQTRCRSPGATKPARYRECHGAIPARSHDR